MQIQPLPPQTGPASAGPAPAALRVNGDRLLQTLDQVGRIGALPGGGVRRLAFSPADQQARSLVRQWMVAAGMQTTIDPAGNLIGRYPGRYPHAPALATGSHLDTVPDGGRYDGTYGVLAGLEAVRSLHDRRIRLDHPVEVIVFADEETTMVGSKAMTGQAILAPESDLAAGLAHIGGDAARLDTAQRTARDLAAFVEVHVEQGPVLEAAGCPIGVVTGIVGQRRYDITVDGQASHAGTTPMTLRQDALVAAARVVTLVNQLGCTTVTDGPPEQVATVGALTLQPNVANTIPGRVELTVDLRDLSNACLNQMEAMLQAELGAIAAATGTRIRLRPRLCNEPVLASSHLQSTIAHVCEDLHLATLALPSRASHDAQNLAQIADMGMIFVPSQGGLSHAAAEYTQPEHCVHGATVLLQTLLRLDQHYCCPGESSAQPQSSDSL